MSVFGPWWPWPLTFDLDLQTRLSEGSNTSSVWIWCKSAQQFPRYFIHKQKVTAPKTELLQFTACGNEHTVTHAFGRAQSVRENVTVLSVQRRSCIKGATVLAVQWWIMTGWDRHVIFPGCGSVLWLLSALTAVRWHKGHPACKNMPLISRGSLPELMEEENWGWGWLTRICGKWH